MDVAVSRNRNLIRTMRILAMKKHVRAPGYIVFQLVWNFVDHPSVFTARGCNIHLNTVRSVGLGSVELAKVAGDIKLLCLKEFLYASI